VQRPVGCDSLGRVTPIFCMTCSLRSDSTAVTRFLHSAFNEAVEMGVLTSNPASKVHPQKQERHEIVPMTPEEVQTFLAAVKEGSYQALYVLAIIAGLRLREAYVSGSGVRRRGVDGNTTAVVLVS
jgi:integrase